MTLNELKEELNKLKYSDDHDVKLLIDPTVFSSNRPLKVEDIERVSVDGNKPIIYLQNFDDYE